MKRYTLLVFAALFALSMAACKKAATAETGDAQTVGAADGTQLPLNLQGSTVAWKGTKKMGDSHNGTISITEGYLVAGGGAISGGKFTIDMTSIKVLDLQGEMADKLAGHLRAGDFFLADSFPTAVFEISSVAAAATDSTTHNITGNLTLRGVTKSVTFPAKVTVGADGAVTAHAVFAIDRTQWGVQYGSSLVEQAADKIINNEIEFTVDITSQAPAPTAAPAS